VLRGLGETASEEPPPLYCFDPLIGRLTVTTPSYTPAIVAISNGAFPYGGIDLARLFDARQRVVSHIGGRAPAGFGLAVRAPNGSVVAASQRPRTVLRPGRRPLVLTRSPTGPVRKGSRYPRRPYAGRFEVLEATGFAEGAGVRFSSHYRFEPDHIDIGWQVSRSRADLLSAEALLPSWGDDAKINVILKTGETRTLTGAAPGLAQADLASVRYFFIDGTESGYVVIPRTLPAGTLGRVLRPKSQSSNPRPGPSLQLRLAGHSRWSSLALKITIAPALDAAAAAAIAERLGAPA
jgi:hypothetical protein